MKSIVYVPLIISAAFVIHHSYIHRDDPNLTESEKMFQIEDIQSHETWVVFFLGVAATAYYIS